MSAISYKRQVRGRDASFLGEYMQSMMNKETAHAYDFWAGVWCIGAACGRGVVVPRAGAEVYSNFYILFVADSGVTRKSTSVSSASKILSNVVGVDDAVWIQGRTTPESLEIKLFQQSEDTGSARAIISVSELVTFLGPERYNLSMPGLLTDLFDSVDERRSGGSLGSGRVTLRNVHVSFLSASTPTWLANAVNPDVVEGGFTSRCIFVHEEQRKAKIAWPKNDPHGMGTEDLASLLRRTVAHAQSVETYYLTDPALKRFERWYKARSYARDAYTRSFESREDDHVLRLAMCLAINDFDTIVRVPHVNRAIRIIAHEKARATHLFAGGVRPDRVILGVNKIIETLIERGAGGVPQTYLFLKCRHLLDATSFNACLDIMHELQMVDRFNDTRRGPGRKSTIWRATKNINDMRVRDDLIAEIEVH